MLNPTQKIILASTSPFRHQLLSATGVDFQWQAPAVEENNITTEKPIKTAELRSLAKAQSVHHNNPRAIVIGCDQVLEFQGQMFNKVPTAEDARKVLHSLSGNTHYLHSSISVLGAQKTITETQTSKMTMRKLSTEAINNYINTGEWQGCAGCYQWENKGSHLFTESTGDTSAIIGLPILQLLKTLRLFGVDPLEKAGF